MKKIVLSIVTLLFTLVAIAQTIESKPNTDFDINELMNEFMMD